ncbi:hypothetical protein [Paracoccus tibetensis]|uniref:Uncharacterized protein n=1 Tax=Paracoccus tibetensis TaxID=336292 RepID=A0A1G5BB68_9RHOB|nr:hypothetical protein [Paracoccus tibetensis]SCX87387.1 hypothetical protein SAMN05660710_00071 [Paracoccus tibetensis]
MNGFNPMPDIQRNANYFEVLRRLAAAGSTLLALAAVPSSSYSQESPSAREMLQVIEQMLEDEFGQAEGDLADLPVVAGSAVKEMYGTHIQLDIHRQYIEDVLVQKLNEVPLLYEVYIGCDGNSGYASLNLDPSSPLRGAYEYLLLVDYLRFTFDVANVPRSRYEAWINAQIDAAQNLISHNDGDAHGDLQRAALEATELSYQLYTEGLIGKPLLFFSEPACGGSPSWPVVSFSTEPPNARLYLLSEFEFRLCIFGGNEGFDIEACQWRDVDVVAGGLQIAGTFMYIGIWSDGRTRTGRIFVDPARPSPDDPYVIKF